MPRKFTEFEILQWASGHFLTEKIPDDWEDMSSAEQDDYLQEHVWEPYVNRPLGELWELIEINADTSIHFFKPDILQEAG